MYIACIFLSCEACLAELNSLCWGEAVNNTIRLYGDIISIHNVRIVTRTATCMPTTNCEN